MAQEATAQISPLMRTRSEEYIELRGVARRLTQPYKRCSDKANQREHALCSSSSEVLLSRTPHMLRDDRHLRRRDEVTSPGVGDRRDSGRPFDAGHVGVAPSPHADESPHRILAGQLEQATQRASSLERQLDMALQSFHETSDRSLFDSVMQAALLRIASLGVAVREAQEDRATDSDFRQRLVAMEGGMTNHADTMGRMDAEITEAIGDISSERSPCRCEPRTLQQDVALRATLWAA